MILDSDLAALYGVRTKALNQAVSRNLARFPADFSFQLTSAEQVGLRSQIVTSKGRGGARYASRAFTEQGVAMLSSQTDLARRIDEREQRYDGQFSDVFDAIRELASPALPESPRPRIGFNVDASAATSAHSSSRSRRRRAPR